MQDFWQGEQTELTEEDITSILTAAALDPEMPMPARWNVRAFSAETRLKFNAPTPVFNAEVGMEWDAPRNKTLVFHALFWGVDCEWEVSAVDGLRV